MSSSYTVSHYTSSTAKPEEPTGREQGRVLIRLPDHQTLGRELRTYIQTDSYLKTKQTGTLPDTTKRILRDRGEENQGRRARLVQILKQMLESASYFASGHPLEINRSDPKAALGEALEYLIQNAYAKMGYIQHQHSNPKQEIQSLLRSNDIEQIALALNTPEGNPEALNDLREYIRLCALSSKQIVLYDLINKRYGDRPYGWPELEVVLLVSKLAVLKEIELIDNNKVAIALDKAYEYLTGINKQRNVIIRRRETADDQLIKNAQRLGKVLFGQVFPGDEENLFRTLQEQLKDWDDSLSEFEMFAKTGYPGGSDIQECRQALRPLVGETNSLRFLQYFLGKENDLHDLEENYQDLKNFYTNQRHSWEQLQTAVRELSQNRLQLESDQEAHTALIKMEEILAALRPYGLLHQVATLKEKAIAYNTELVSDSRQQAITSLQTYLDRIMSEVSGLTLDPSLQSQAIAPLQRLIKEVEQSSSIAHIRQAQVQGESAFDQGMRIIEQAVIPPERGKKDTDIPPRPQLKPRRLVEVKSLCPEGFIENQEQIDQFLTALRQELERAIAANERIQIK